MYNTLIAIVILCNKLNRYKGQFIVWSAGQLGQISDCFAKLGDTVLCNFVIKSF